MANEASCSSRVKEYPTKIYWLEQTVADVPTDNCWLSVAELRRLDALHFEKRRIDWRLGRWTAKCALLRSRCVNSRSFADIEILPTESGAPEVLFHNKPAAVSISLSHRAGTAACAISGSGVALGCDLELVEPRSDAFIADYFTRQEEEMVSRAPEEYRWFTVALLWSGKESSLKTLGAGLRIDTRRVVVHVDEECTANGNKKGEFLPIGNHRWHTLWVAYENKQLLHGWWQVSGGLVKTIVSALSPVPPIELLTRSPVA